MLLREWFLQRTKIEIASMALIPILIITIVIISTTINGSNGTILLNNGTNSEEIRCTSNECIKAATRLLNIIDPGVDPCDNFYEFVCGNFIKSDSENSDLSNFFDHYTNILRAKLKRIIDEPIIETDTNSLKLAKQFYQTCQIERDKRDDWEIRYLINDLGGWPLIDGDKWNEDFNWTEIMINAREAGLDFNWLIEIQENFGMLQVNYPTNLLKSDNSVWMFSKYFMRQMALYFSKNQVEINETDITDTINFQNEITELVDKAKNARLNADKMYLTAETFTEKWPQIDWVNFLNTLTRSRKFRSSTLLINFIESYFDNLIQLIENTPKRVIANYIVWRTLLSLSPYMSKIIQDDFVNYSSFQSKRTLDISDICFQSTTIRMKNVIESEYYRRYNISDFKFNPVLFGLIEEMKNRISNNTWMDQSTRDSGVRRFDEIRTIFGGFDNFDNATIFDRTNGYRYFRFLMDRPIFMARALKLNEYQTKFSKITRLITNEPRLGPFDWTLANAIFLMSFNTMVVGLGILQDDYFTENRPNYLNYGGIGWILSHELSHALDNSNHKYLSGHNLVDWITKKSLKQFRKRLTCVTDEYNRIVIEQLQRNRTQNLLEDSADFIAPDIAYGAYQKVSDDDLKLANFDYNRNQLFWIQYGSFLCYKKTMIPGILDNDDSHSLPIFRVNGPLRNSKYFANDFNCSLGTFMNPSDKCDLI